MNNDCSPKRVLFVDHTAKMGGGEIALLNLVQKLDHDRYEPVVLLLSEGPLALRLSAAGIETHLLPLRTTVVQTRKDSLGLAALLRFREVAATLAHVWRVSRFIKKHQIALVHTNSLKADLIGGFAAKLAHRPLVWHIRDRIEEDYLPSPVVRVFRFLSRTVPDLVIANSAATLNTVRLERDELAETVPSGIKLGARMQAVHDGLDEIAARSSVSSPGQRLVALVGRITPWKGQDIFLKAAAIVHERFPDVRFQIIGAPLFDEQEYERELRRLCNSLGLEECVEFTGFRDDVPELIERLEILVHASTTGEPFGQVVIEAMAASKPVVATAGGGVPEIVQDGVTGLLVPMGDAVAMASAICRLLEDQDTARQMGVLGRHRVREHFTIQNTAAKVERLYDELLAGRRRSASGSLSAFTSLTRPQERNPKSRLTTAGAAVVALVLGAVVVAWGAQAVAGNLAPITAPFVAVIAVAAGLFGRRAGWLATAAAAAALAYFVLPPRFSFTLQKEAVPALGLTVAIGLLVTGLIGMFQSASDSARQATARSESARHSLNFLATSGAALSLPVRVENVLQTVGYLATSRLCDVCRVDLMDRSETLDCVHCSSRDPTQPGCADAEFVAADGGRLLMRTFETAAPVFSSDGTSPVAPAVSYLLVPLATRGRVIGVLSLISRQPGLTYRQQDLSIATEFAWRAAQAIDAAISRDRAGPRENTLALPMVYRRH